MFAACCTRGRRRVIRVLIGAHMLSTTLILVLHSQHDMIQSVLDTDYVLNPSQARFVVYAWLSDVCRAVTIEAQM